MAIFERRTIRQPDPAAAAHRLGRAVRGVHPETVTGDIPLLGDLNRIAVEERFGVGGTVKDIADTAASALTPQGFRVFGSAIAGADCGLVAGGVTGGCDLRSSGADGDVAAIGTVVMWEPDTNAPVRASALIEVDDLTGLAVFFGFAGEAPDNMGERVTGAASTATLADDNLAGLWFDAGLTAGAALLTPHNKGGASATQDAADIATGLTVPADTTMIWTVEMAPNGDVFWSADGKGVRGEGIVKAALETDEEHALVLYVASQGAVARNLRVLALGVDGYARTG